MKEFFIADTHFGKDTLLRFENRPFANVQEMDEEIICRWNSVVGPEDRVWVLGDFGAEGYEAEVLSRLNGTKFLVKGNHDENTNQFYRDVGFLEVYDYPVIVHGFYILSHRPLHVSVNMPYANIFGHVHNHPAYLPFSAHHFCVCVELLDYTPVEFERVLATCSMAGNCKNTNA